MELGYCSHCHRLVHLILRNDGGEICHRCGRVGGYQKVELKKRTEIETICAWCGVHMSGAMGADREHISHGICEKCLEAEFPEKVTA